MNGMQDTNGGSPVMKVNDNGKGHSVNGSAHGVNGVNGSHHGLNGSANELPIIKLNEGNEDIEDTPLEFLETFLTQLRLQAASVKSFPVAMTKIIKHSLDLVKGLMTYPVDMSSELSDDAKLLAKGTNDMDYEKLFLDGKTGRMKFFKEMSSDPLQGNFLKMLVRMTGAKRILEIGTFTGFAALNMAEALPSDGHLVTIEMIPAFADFAEEFISRTKQNDKIEIQIGSALEILPKLGERHQQFDLVFIDADKHEYKDYIKVMLDQNILAPGGTIIADNTIYKGASFVSDFPHAIFATLGPHVHDFNTYLLNEPRVEQVMLPIRDGVTIIRRIGE